MAWQSLRSALLLAAGAASVAGCRSEPLDAGNGVEDAGTPQDYSSSACWGETASTTFYSGETHELTDVAATCRAEGERALLYVADELWERGVTQTTVNGFMDRFDRGVLPRNEDVFGALPAGKLAVFVLDTEAAGEGYLCGWCEDRALHLDGILLDPLDGDEALSIAAHESVHAIHHGYDLDEEPWVDETLAQAGMTVNGFFTDQDWLGAYLMSTNVDWGPGGAPFQYGAGLLYGSYLWERGGAELLAAITRQPARGWEGIDAALQEIALTQSAWELYLDMAVAAYVQDPEAGFGFQSFDFDRPRMLGQLTTGGSISGRLAAYGLAYYAVDATVGSVRVSAASAISGRLVAGNTGAVTNLSEGVSVATNGEGFVVLSATAATDFELTAE